MKKLAFEWKVLIFGKLAFVPCLIGITWFLGHQYLEFIHARHNLTAGQELHQLSQLYREIVQERGTGMLFLRGRTSIFEFKDVVKKSEEVQRRLNLLSKDSESLVAKNMMALRSLREEIYTQGMTPDQAFAGYQNILFQIQKSLSLTIDLREATVATTSNLIFEDVASLRDLLIQQAIVNMPLSTQDFNLLLVTATLPTLHENVLVGNGQGPVWAALQGWQDLDGQKAIKKKLDFMIKTSDQGNFKISPEEIYTDSIPVLRKIDGVAKIAFEIFLDKLKDEEKGRRLSFVYYFVSIFCATMVLGVGMRMMYRHAIYHHKHHIWRERKRMAALKGPVQLNLSSDQGRFLGEKITALQVYPLRYKAAYYNKSVDQENGNQELESINFDFTTDVEALCLAVKNSETAREVPASQSKAFTRHQVSGEVKMVVNHLSEKKVV
ncbi:MAG: hypothetical protein A2X86_19135 [Bdellovibrionales bacterium GWA2_49_15]|nr:MAG: hypothetical protein A2X86_19135 [Bdellovibrionales bacterium GWA2_49_15]HAZ14342.1 hypothetical protein [Bdellovibrionales bacterium]